MLESLMKRLRGAPESAAALAEAIREAEAGLPAIENAFATAEAERAGLLLAGTDREVLAAEDRMTAARLKRDRLTAAIGELRSRHDEAVASEAEADYQRRRALANEVAETAIGKIPGRLRELLAEAGALHAEFVAAERAAEAFNSCALELRRADFIRRPTEALADQPLHWLQRAAAL